MGFRCLHRDLQHSRLVNIETNFFFVFLINIQGSENFSKHKTSSSSSAIWWNLNEKERKARRKTKIYRKKFSFIINGSRTQCELLVGPAKQTKCGHNSCSVIKMCFAMRQEERAETEKKEMTMNPIRDSAKEDTQISKKNARRTKATKKCSEWNVSIFFVLQFETQILRHLHQAQVTDDYCGCWLWLVTNYQASQKSSTEKMMKCNSMHM